LGVQARRYYDETFSHESGVTRIEGLLERAAAERHR
jgi:hypothetical protein